MKKILLMISLVVIGLFLMGCASQEALSGEAIKVQKQTTPVIQKTTPKIEVPANIAENNGISECRLLPLDVPPADMSSPWDGNRLCKEHFGYNLCLWQSFYAITSYYENKTECIGKIQYEMVSVPSIGCNQQPFQYNGNWCSIENEEEYTEPIAGASQLKNYPAHIVCCK